MLTSCAKMVRDSFARYGGYNRYEDHCFRQPRQKPWDTFADHGG